MNTDILKGQWKQIRGRIQEEWGDLTNDDLDRINGNYDQLIGKLQERYGHSRDEAVRELDRFLQRQTV
jgi:uncharacterized protein YjbJ (UPF0337 family)